MTNNDEKDIVIHHHSLRISLNQFVSDGNELTRKNQLSRVRSYEKWIADSGQNILQADLRAYRDHLLGESRNLSPSTVNAHLNSIRGCYRRMMKSVAYRQMLSELATHFAQVFGMQIQSIADQLAVVNEMEKRIENLIFSDDVFTSTVVVQDIADEDKGLRLTEAQATQLIRMPDIRGLRGLRDASLLSLMICTGIREHEVVSVQVGDLQSRYEGLPALRVRSGKGSKQRLIPYGNLIWCLDYADAWLRRTGITSGFVFRGFWGDSDSIRPTALSVRQINRILARYPVNIDGNTVVVRPHDLRRTYARIQFNSGMEAEALQQNMGHASYDTTLRYIGNLDASKRMSQSSMPMPHHNLNHHDRDI